MAIGVFATRERHSSKSREHGSYSHFAAGEVYEQGLADGLRGMDPQLRLAGIEAAANSAQSETRQQLDEELAELTLKAEKQAEVLQEVKTALAARRPGGGLLGVLSVVVVGGGGWFAETSMTVPVVDVLYAPHPLIVWGVAAFIAGIATYATKHAIGDDAPLGKPRHRIATAVLAVAIVTLLGWFRADALVAESLLEDGFVADLIGGRFWGLFCLLVVIYGGSAYLTALGFETAVYAWASASLRRKAARLERAHRQLLSKIGVLQSQARNVESATKTALRASTTRYEMGFAEGACQRGSGGVASPSNGWLSRVLSTFGIRLLLVATLTAMSTGCGYTSDGITSVVQDSFNTTPKNITAVILEPFGEAAMPQSLALQVAQDVVARSSRCTTLLFATTNGFQRHDESYRLVLPCNASRTRRDGDLDKAYDTFDREFGGVLTRWWTAPKDKDFVLDFSGTFQRVAEEIQNASGQRVAIVISTFWWIDFEKGPPTLGPLPDISFARTKTYLGFTNAYGRDYEYWYKGRRHTFSNMPMFIEAWGSQFKRWGAEPVNTAAFGPQNAREWIARNIGSSETDAYRKWRQAHPIRTPRRESDLTRPQRRDAPPTPPFKSSAPAFEL